MIGSVITGEAFYGAQVGPEIKYSMHEKRVTKANVTCDTNYILNVYKIGSVLLPT